MKIIFLVIFVCAGSCFPMSIIRNWDFEKTDNEATPADWELSATDEGLKVSLDKISKFSGKSSLKIEITRPAKVEIKSKEFPLEGGKNYRLTLWCKTKNFTGRGNETTASFIIWAKDKEGRKLTIVNRGITSSEIPWKFVDAIFPVPENVVSGYISLYVHVPRQDLISYVWFDRIRLNPFSSLPVPTIPETFSYSPETFAISGGSKIIEDVSSTCKKAVFRAKGEKVSVLHFGPYQTDQRPGQYKVIFRLKVADNTSEKYVAGITVGSNYVLNTYLASKEIRGTDFKKPGTWQEFEIEFIRPPSGWISAAVYFRGETDLYSETYTIMEEKIFKTDREIMEFY